MNRPERAAARRQEQLAIGRGHLVGVVALDVAHDQHAGGLGIVERRGHGGAHRRRLQMARAGARLGHHPVGQRFGQLVVGGSRHAQRIAQGRRGDRPRRATARSPSSRTARWDRASGGTCRHRSRAFWIRSTANQSTKAGRARCAGRAAWRATPRASARSGWRASGPRPRCAPRWPESSLSASPSSLVRSAWRSRRTGASICSSACAQPVGRLEQAGVERAHVAFQAEALVVARGAGAHLLAHQGEELLGRAQRRCRRRAASASWARAVAAARSSRRRSAFCASTSSPSRSLRRRSRPRARLPRRPSAPSSQRRRSEASTPLRCAAKAPSAASNR